MSAVINNSSKYIKQTDDTEAQVIEIAMDQDAEASVMNNSSNTDAIMDEESESCYPDTNVVDANVDVGSVSMAKAQNINTAKSVVTLANPVPPMKINGTLYCINIKWPDKASDGNMQRMAQQISSEYSMLSNNNIIFKPVGINFTTKLECSSSNLHAVEQNAIQKALNGKPKTPNDFFIIVNHGAINRSHTSISQHISHNLNALVTTGAHELGHQFGLLHSNKAGKDGASRDGTSFMSMFQSKTLASPQLYNLGCLNDQTAYHPENASCQYTLWNLNSYPTPDSSHLKAVILPQQENQAGHRLFLSYTSTANDDNILVLHQENAGKKDIVANPNEKKRNLGSTLMVRFSNSVNYGGYNIQTISRDDNSVTVNVTPSKISSTNSFKP